MSLYSQWTKIAFEHTEEKDAVEFWEKYCAVEKGIYEKVLEVPTTNIKGQLSELAKEYGVDDVTFVGFIDGINTSLTSEIDLEKLAEDSNVELNIDLEKLYFNMLNANAEWLYTLPQWDAILTVEQRKEIKKSFNATKTVVNDEKIGRNDACPCGSGKKYKKCCGK
ncbi:SEC-C metal-binding domain-containing protein [Alkaliphilus oremlandii]|uniref:SEC-C motif domain protein n=1 Tax=Alkaliphilus oremlandii (strain OhILAs) TaxID=350688 RepID=A8MKY8_ALKOO|nr:SEC-C metal-binding domain-containing protein [Alkaliphilus oremlandii]ABW17805.1 SEC-C motif domain protein [Alkaliphilus oremlandii OhILAs]